MNPKNNEEKKSITIEAIAILLIGLLGGAAAIICIANVI